jgi:ribosome-binding factor A
MKMHRAERVASLIREELSRFLLREVEFPEGSLVTISHVDVDKELATAAVWVSIIPEASKEEAMKILKSEQGRMQFLLNRKMNIKPMPRINFLLDEGLEKAAAIEKILLDTDNQ